MVKPVLIAITGTQQLEQIIRHFQKLPEVMEVFRVGT